jgi:hypothetical protein
MIDDNGAANYGTTSYPVLSANLHNYVQTAKLLKSTFLDFYQPDTVFSI